MILPDTDAAALPTNRELIHKQQIRDEFPIVDSDEDFVKLVTADFNGAFMTGLKHELKFGGLAGGTLKHADNSPFEIVCTLFL